VWVYLYSNFRCRLRKTHVLCNGLRNGCPRSLILESKARIQFPTSHQKSPSPFLVPFQRYCRFSAENSDPTLFHPNFAGVRSHWTRLSMLGFRSVLITFELTHVIWPVGTVPQHNRRTDGRTDGRLTNFMIAIPRYAPVKKLFRLSSHGSYCITCTRRGSTVGLL